MASPPATLPADRRERALLVRRGIEEHGLFDDDYAEKVAAWTAVVGGRYEFDRCLDIERTELVRGAAPSSQADPVHSTGVYYTPPVCTGSQITEISSVLHPLEYLSVRYS